MHTDKYNQRGIANQPLRMATVPIAQHGVWQVKQGKRVLQFNAREYSIDVLRDAFPRAVIRRIYPR